MESELNTIIYVEMDIQLRAIAVGFPKYQIQCTNNPPVSGGYSHGITIEQLERWIWKEHRELFPLILLFYPHRNINSEPMWNVLIVEKIGEHKSWEHICDAKGSPIALSDPFSARLAGVERVIEILEQQSIPPMEKGE